MVNTPFRVLIIGGGPAGLLTAQALKKNGIQSTVFEQDAALDARQRDWNFGVYWAQTPLSDCVPDELSQMIIEKGQVDRRPLDLDDAFTMVNSVTGEVLARIPAPNHLRLHRRNFLRLITPGIDIRYGKRLRRIESDGKMATAHFEDGTSDSGNLLIGAEGAHSLVREYLLGKEEAQLTKSPNFASVTMAKLPKEAAQKFYDIHHRYVLGSHPTGEFFWLSMHDNFEGTQPGDWTFMIIMSRTPEEEYDPATLQGPAILADIKERAGKYGEPFAFMLKSIPEGTKCWHNQLTYWITKPWDNRNSTVTLIGDAAHPMTFHRGQGLNNSIHDVASLAKHLREIGTDIPIEGDSAVTTYERELWVRGKLAVEGSLENTLALHNWETLQQSAFVKSGTDKDVAKH